MERVAVYKKKTAVHTQAQNSESRRQDGPHGQQRILWNHMVSSCNLLLLLKSAVQLSGSLFSKQRKMPEMISIRIISTKKKLCSFMLSYTSYKEVKLSNATLT